MVKFQPQFPDSLLKDLDARLAGGLRDEHLAPGLQSGQCIDKLAPAQHLASGSGESDVALKSGFFGSAIDAVCLASGLPRRPQLS